jgi:hypothetical protein
VFDKYAGAEMIDVYMPTTDGRKLVRERYTEPERDLKLLLGELKLVLPEQPLRCGQDIQAEGFHVR